MKNAVPHSSAGDAALRVEGLALAPRPTLVRRQVLSCSREHARRQGTIGKSNDLRRIAFGTNEIHFRHQWFDVTNTDNGSFHCNKATFNEHTKIGLAN